MPDRKSQSVKPAAGRRGRPPQENIPATRRQRDRLRAAARRHVAARQPVPPLTFNELYDHTEAALGAAGCDEKYRKWLAVIVNNEAWRERLAGVPFDRRLLLLPKCLRDEAACPGVFDELGLVCQSCGRCLISEFKAEAERLGYAVLVTEGTAVVQALIRSGKIEAVVGVSCLVSLEQVFPQMEAAAIPALAIPLLYDGCAGTRVDADWVWDAIRLASDETRVGLDLDALRRQVDSWFTREALEALLGAAGDPTAAIACEWLARAGKRWRPLLAAGVFQALAGGFAAPVPEAMRRVAVAVECFHKASLVHDDIEDADELRYGEKTLHAQHGVPIALNVGDFLLGEGYRLIAEAGFSADQCAAMLAAAAHGHRDLCLGQGAELSWTRAPRPLAPGEVLEIFRKKTAPAFAVALRLGAIAAGADRPLWDVLDGYSEALGVAYQVRDDLNDFLADGPGADAHAARPSIILALAYARADGEARDMLAALWRRLPLSEAAGPPIAQVLADLKVEEAAARLLRAYQDRALGAIQPLTSPDLKGLLRRVIGRIFDGCRTKETIRDLEARDAPGRALGAGPAA